MQPDYTFALKLSENLSQVRQRFVKALAYPATPGCLLFAPQQPTRLIALADELTTLTALAPNLLPAQVLADVITSNFNRVRNLSAAVKGPYRLCGKTERMLLTRGRPKSLTIMFASGLSLRLMYHRRKSCVYMCQLTKCCCCHSVLFSESALDALFYVSITSRRTQQPNAAPANGPATRSLPKRLLVLLLCLAVACTSPPQQPNEAQPWVGCKPGVGSRCTAACAAGLQGLGYNAICAVVDGSAAWRVTGDCIKGDACANTTSP
jgi:hypothetical protein